MLRNPFFNLLYFLLVYALACVPPEQHVKPATVPDFQNSLGVEYVAVTDAAYGGPGALVTATYPCTTAEVAGVKLGDVIQFVGNRRVRDDLKEIITGLPLNETVTLGLLRDGKRMHVTATLKAASTKPRARAVPYSGLATWHADPGPLVVLCVEPGSPMAAAGIQRGDTITTIGSQPVLSETVEDVLSAFDFGTQVQLSVVRNGVTVPATVTLGEFESAPTRLDIGDITTTRTTIGRVVDIEPITINNCYGTETRETTRAITRKRATRINLGVNADLKAYGVLPFVLAQNTINAKLDAELASDEAETKGEVMKAKPGTIAHYVIKWYEISSEGTVAIAANGQQYLVPFTLTNRLRGEVESRPSMPCSAAN